MRRETLQNGLNRPILSGRIHGLKQEDDPFFLFRIEPPLQLINPAEIFLRVGKCLVPIPA